MSYEYSRSLIVTSIVGILLSTYALYVEMAAESRSDYKAFCDLSEYASCSRVLTSKYSKAFGLAPNKLLQIPNCIYGIVFYCIMIFLSTYENGTVVILQLALSVLSLAMSMYLAYLLIFVLRDFCVVCVSTYFVNIALAVLSNLRREQINIKNK